MARNEVEFYKLAGGFDSDEDEKEGEVKILTFTTHTTNSLESTPAAAMPDPTEEENAAEGAAMELDVAEGLEKMEVEGEKMDLD
ncbi:hypothetical protein PG987_007978 [Apiospora arundinis]